MVKMVDAFRDAGLPIYFRAWYRSPDASGTRFDGWKVDSIAEDVRQAKPINFAMVEATQILPEVAPKTAIEKARSWVSCFYNMFFGVPLHQDLQRQGVDSLVIIGGFSMACISSTTIYAQSLGYNVIIAADAVAPWAFDQKWPDSAHHLTALASRSVGTLKYTASAIGEVRSSRGSSSSFKGKKKKGGVPALVTPGLKFAYPYAANRTSDVGKVSAFRFDAPRRNTNGAESMEETFARLRYPFETKPIPHWKLESVARSYGLLVIGEIYESIPARHMPKADELHQLFQKRDMPTQTVKVRATRVGSGAYECVPNALELFGCDGSGLEEQFPGVNTLVLAGGPVGCGALPAVARLAWDRNFDIVLAADAIDAIPGADLDDLTSIAARYSTSELVARIG